MLCTLSNATCIAIDVIVNDTHTNIFISNRTNIYYVVYTI